MRTVSKRALFKGLWQEKKVSFCMAHVFYFCIIEQSILSQPVWSPCEKWTSVIFTLSFLYATPSSSWGEHNDLQPWCIEKIIFSPSSRGSSHALSHVDCVASAAWIKVTASAFPSPCRRGGHSHFMRTLMSACVCAHKAKNDSDDRCPTETRGQIVYEQPPTWWVFPHVCGSKNGCFYCSQGSWLRWPLILPRYHCNYAEPCIHILFRKPT